MSDSNSELIACYVSFYNIFLFYLSSESDKNRKDIYCVQSLFLNKIFWMVG